MVDLSSISYPKPKDWPAFERAMRVLFQDVWNDPQTQNNGRPGQRQHGVDVFGNRGGPGGPQAGVQCKGKDSDFGHAVTKRELEAEVKKTEEFKPPLKEFILATTAPDDGPIQEAARLLEKEIRAAGRDMSIAVWGWGRIEQEIARHPGAIQALHPDATPFTGQILDNQAEMLRLLRRLAPAEVTADDQRQAAIRPPVATQIAADNQPRLDALDQHLHDQIDTYRDTLIRANRPRTALDLLTRLKEKVWATASPRVKFRIVANIGAAHHRLGEQDVAADFFLEAITYSPDEVTGIANKIAALLIKGRTAEAHELAVSASATHPDNADIALQRLQARGGTETVEGLWATLSTAVTGNEHLIIFRIAAAREERRPEWREMAVLAAEAHPANERLQIFKAESVLERVLAGDASMLGHLGPGTPTQAELTAAADRLEAAYKATLNLETPAETALAHNAALLLKILRQSKRAAELLDDAMSHGLALEETLRLRLSFYRRPNETTEAIKLAERLPDTPQSRILRADLHLDVAPEQARALLADRTRFESRRDTVAAAQVYVESLVHEKKFDEAFAEAERFAAAYPNDPNGPLLRFRIRRGRADRDADTELGAAIAMVDTDTDFPMRFLVAEALESARRFDDVVDLLGPCTSTAFDSPALRSLVAAAANSDRRSVLKDVLDRLPADLRKMPFYRGARIALANRAGDLRAAEREIRGYLADRPRSLHMHLQLMHILFRQNKLDALRGEAAKPASAFEGNPADLMKLAQFKDDFGDWREAHALAYATLLANPGDQAVSMGYMGVFLRPGHSTEMEVSPAAVAADMAVEVKTEANTRQVFIIEPEAALRLSNRYVAPDHALAQALLGQALNAAIVLPDGTPGTITFIKPKQLHAFHELLANFQNTFPDAEGFERVRFNPSAPDGLAEISERLQERHDAIEQVGKLYDSGTLPIALAGRLLGNDPVDTLIGLSRTGHSIRVCLGTHPERNAAMAAITANDRKGCVVDALTLHVIRRLDLFDAVESVCGPIAIVDHTLQRLQNKLQELQARLDQPDMSLSWNEGKIYRSETTVAEKREALALLQADLEFLSERTAVLPAVGARDLSPELRQLVNRMGGEFLDELRAAEASGRLLVSEDMMLRGVGQAEFGLKSTWLQPVLMKARDTGVITLDQCRKAVVAMIDTRFTFISIDSGLLTGAVSDLREIKVPDDFAKLASRLGGASADLASHLGVAYGAIRAFWRDDSIPWTARQALVGTLFGNLLKERLHDQMVQIVHDFVLFGRKTLNDWPFIEYLGDWLRGHFIQIEPR